MNPSLCVNGVGGIAASNQELFSQNCNGLVFDARGNGDGVTCQTVTGDHAGRPTDYTPVVCRMTAFGEYEIDGTASTMKQRDYKDATDLVVAFAQNSRDEVRLQNGDGQICGALTAEPGMKQQTYIAVQDVIHGEKACNGKGWNENGAAYTLDTMATQGVCVAFERRFVRTTGGQPSEGVNPCLRADTNAGDGAPCVAFGWNKSAAQSLRVDDQTTDALQASPSSNPAIACDFLVRRLTPIECERLMGFPDNFTRIPWRNKPAEDCPDGPRYKACGNSMGVNVMRWIGTRIQEVEESK